MQNPLSLALQYRTTQSAGYVTNRFHVPMWRLQSATKPSNVSKNIVFKKVMQSFTLIVPEQPSICHSSTTRCTSPHFYLRHTAGCLCDSFRVVLNVFAHLICREYSWGPCGQVHSEHLKLFKRRAVHFRVFLNFLSNQNLRFALRIRQRVTQYLCIPAGHTMPYSLMAWGKIKKGFLPKIFLTEYTYRNLGVSPARITLTEVAMHTTSSTDMYACGSLAER